MSNNFASVHLHNHHSKIISPKFEHFAAFMCKTLGYQCTLINAEEVSRFKYETIHNREKKGGLVLFYTFHHLFNFAWRILIVDSGLTWNWILILCLSPMYSHCSILIFLNGISALALFFQTRGHWSLRHKRQVWSMPNNGERIWVTNREEDWEGRSLWETEGTAGMRKWIKRKAE